MGNNVEPFNWWNIAGLVVVLGGFLFYSIYSKEFREKKEKEEDKASYAPINTSTKTEDIENEILQ